MRFDIVERKFHCTRIKIDKDQTFPRCDQFDLEQSVLLRYKSRRFIELGGLGQPALVIVLPTMIFAGEPGRRPTRLTHHGVRTMSTNIMESSKCQIFAQDDEEGKASHVKRVIVAGLMESAAVTNKQPCLKIASVWSSSERDLMNQAAPNRPC